MARLSKLKLFTEILKALRADGWTVKPLSAPKDHPLRFEMQREEQTRRVRVYVWNLTHGGGRMRPQHEYRIQITSGVGAFEAEPDGTTLILGWSEEFGVFAAFDLAHHAGALGASPSIQIGAPALTEAARIGVASQEKGNHEVAVAVRPDRLSAYIANFDAAHRGETGAIIGAAAADDVENEEGDIDFLAMAGPDQAHHLGHPEEVAQRRTVLARLEALEREMEAIRPKIGMMGHNNPPEATEPDPGILAEEIRDATTTIGQELREEAPEPLTIAKGASALQRIWKLLRAGRDHGAKFARAVGNKARDKAAEIIGGAIGGSVLYAPQILEGLQAAVQAIARWFHLIV